VTDFPVGSLERYEMRMALYRSLGYDRLAATRYAVDQLGTFDGDVLDVGSGQGLLAIELGRRGGLVTSIDSNADEQRVGVANAGHQGVAERIAFLTADARMMPFDDGSFGAVAMMDALHHLEDAPAIFSEMRRVLAPGGKILLAEMTAEGFAIVARVHRSEGRVHPVGPVTVAAAVNWFVSRGFRLLSLSEEHLHTFAVLAGTPRNC